MRTSLIVMLLISLISCNTNQKEDKQDIKTKATIEEDASQYGEVEKNIVHDSRGYELMTQKCYICHFEKPDPSKSSQMIAPPMLMVQQHYKPAYPDKEEFINAVVSIIQDPSEEKTLMPGAVKNFKLMPKLIYEEEELRLIAAALYDYDFGSAPNSGMKMMGGGKLQLNNGKKWVLKKESVAQINAVTQKLNTFNSTTVSDYNQLGKDIFNDAKSIMLDDSYTGELYDQIHVFFAGIETNMHALIAAKSKEEAENQLAELKIKFNNFHNYFE